MTLQRMIKPPEAVHVDSPQVVVSEPQVVVSRVDVQVGVESPQVGVEAPQVKVESPQVGVESPQVTIGPWEVNVVFPVTNKLVWLAAGVVAGSVTLSTGLIILTMILTG